MGARITFDGARDGLGQAGGVTGGEVVAQLEIASAQVSHNSSRDGRGRLPIIFMFVSDLSHFLGLGVLGVASAELAVQLRLERGHALLRRGITGLRVQGIAAIEKCRRPPEIE